MYDAIVVGAGPNGLAAAIELARAGKRVRVVEAEPTLGGGVRTAELTLPGFRHDVCSAVHPMAAATGWMAAQGLEAFGLEWIQPPLALAHPLDDGRAAVLETDLEKTAERLGPDRSRYLRLLRPVVKNWRALVQDALGPLRWPRHPLALAGFGLRAFRPAAALARGKFRSPAARALWAGLAAHSLLPLEEPGSSAIALILAAAGHVAGWPIPRGGSQSIADAMAACLISLGGEIEAGTRVASLAELPPARAVLCDVAPGALVAMSGGRMPSGYRRRLEAFRPGPGVFKMDWALRAPIPWAADACRRAGTVHLGGTLEEIAASERAACAADNPRPPQRPFVLLSQPSLFDPSRAPAGQHTAWAYCHVPNASTADMAAAIEAQIERFAPGFAACILARSARGPAQLERHNANLVGGDIAGGRNSLGQLLRRPAWRAYRTPLAGVFLCSASTPPGGGVHGLCGVHAARAALRYLQARG